MPREGGAAGKGMLRTVDARGRCCPGWWVLRTGSARDRDYPRQGVLWTGGARNTGCQCVRWGPLAAHPSLG